MCCARMRYDAQPNHKIVNFNFITLFFAVIYTRELDIKNSNPTLEIDEKHITALNEKSRLMHTIATNWIEEEI